MPPRRFPPPWSVKQRKQRTVLRLIPAAVARHIVTPVTEHVGAFYYPCLGGYDSSLEIHVPGALPADRHAHVLCS